MTLVVEPTSFMHHTWLFSYLFQLCGSHLQYTIAMPLPFGKFSTIHIFPRDILQTISLLDPTVTNICIPPSNIHSSVIIPHKTTVFTQLRIQTILVFPEDNFILRFTLFALDIDSKQFIHPSDYLHVLLLRVERWRTWQRELFRDSKFISYWFAKWACELFQNGFHFRLLGLSLHWYLNLIDRLKL